MLENPLHLLAQSDDIAKTMQKFKAYTAYEFMLLYQGIIAFEYFTEYQYTFEEIKGFMKGGFSL